MGRKFIFFKIRVWSKKTLREAGGQQKQVFENISNGAYEKGPRTKNGHRWSLLLGLGKILKGKDMGNGMGIGPCYIPRQWGCPERTGHGQNKPKTSNYDDFGSSLVQIDFRLGRSP